MSTPYFQYMHVEINSLLLQKRLHTDIFSKYLTNSGNVYYCFKNDTSQDIYKQW